MPAEAARLLLVAATPRDLERVRPDVENREIFERLADLRDRVETRLIPAVRASDLARELGQFQPQLFHFSGHAELGGLCLEGDDGRSVPVSPETLVALLQPFRDTVRVVVLNACRTDGLARELAARAGIPRVIGMEGDVDDDLATRFAVGFYGALFRRRQSGESVTVDEAFREAAWTVSVGAGPEAAHPMLASAPGLESATVVLAGAGDAGGAERRALDDARGRLPRAVAYKRIHDLLQEIEGVFRPLQFAVQDGDRVLPAGQIAWRSVRAGCSHLAGQLGELRSLLARSPFAGDTVALGQDAEAITVRLRAIGGTADLEALLDTLDSIEDLLGKQLPMMDWGLMESLEQIGLIRLGEVLGRMVPASVPVPAPAPTPGRDGPGKRETGTGAPALTGHIERLRRVHHALQELDDALRLAERSVRLEPRKVRNRWRDRRLRGHLDQLPPGAAEVADIARIETLWAVVEVAVSSDDPAAFPESLANLRDGVRAVFNEVDVDLRAKVEELNTFGPFGEQPLTSAA